MVTPSYYVHHTVEALYFNHGMGKVAFKPMALRDGFLGARKPKKINLAGTRHGGSVFLVK